MEMGEYRFGSLTIDGTSYHQDVYISTAGKVTKRQKELSEGYSMGHTPLGPKEMERYLEVDSPDKIVVGTGMHGAMRVMDEARACAQGRGMELICEPTGRAIESYMEMRSNEEKVAAVLHLTC